MPIYEFKCKSCLRVHEMLCNVGVKAIELACPDCNGPVMRKFSMFRSHGFAGDSENGEAATASAGGCGTCVTQNCSTCSSL